MSMSLTAAMKGSGTRRVSFGDSIILGISVQQSIKFDGIHFLDDCFDPPVVSSIIRIRRVFSLATILLDELSNLAFEPPLTTVHESYAPSLFLLAPQCTSEITVREPEFSLPICPFTAPFPFPLLKRPTDREEGNDCRGRNREEDEPGRP